MLIFDWYVKVSKSLCSRVRIRVNTALNHVDTRTILPRYEGFAWYINLKGIKNKNTVKYPYLNEIGICEFLIIHTEWYQKKTIPDRHWSLRGSRMLCDESSKVVHIYIYTGEEMGRTNQDCIQHCEKRILPRLYLWCAADFWILWCCTWW